MRTMLLQRKANLIENWPEHFAFCERYGLLPSVGILSSNLKDMTVEERSVAVAQYLDVLPNLQTLANEALLIEFKRDIHFYVKNSFEEAIKVWLRRACLINLFPQSAAFIVKLSRGNSEYSAKNLLLASEYFQSDFQKVLGWLAQASHLTVTDGEGFGVTPLRKALYSATNEDPAPSLCEVLVTAGVSIKASTLDQNALMMASKRQLPKLCQFLLANGADPNIVPARDFGYTPLEVAVDHQNIPIIKMLLAAGADTEYQDEEHRTPFQRALAKNKNESAACLLAHVIIEKLKAEKIQGKFEAHKERILVDLKFAQFPVEHMANESTEAILANAWKQAMAEIEEARQNEAADHFAAMVGNTDAYFGLKQEVSSKAQENAKKYLKIASRLSMELQMTLSHRAVGSTKTFVLTKNFAPAFKRLEEGVEATSKRKTALPRQQM